MTRILPNTFCYEVPAEGNASAARAMLRRSKYGGETVDMLTDDECLCAAHKLFARVFERPQRIVKCELLHPEGASITGLEQRAAFTFDSGFTVILPAKRTHPEDP